MFVPAIAVRAEGSFAIERVACAAAVKVKVTDADDATEYKP
jgi:hypothetical protein